MPKVKKVTAQLRGPFEKLKKYLDVVEFDAPKFNKNTVGGLEPNIYYKAGKDAVGKPKYEYLTDDMGRITAAYAEDLKLKPKGQKRGPHNSKTPGKLTGDDAGHLIADMFDGSGKLDNLVSQKRSINQGDWRKMEESWAKALEEGSNVEVLIEVGYKGADARPSHFDVRYVIDGVESKKRFKN